MKRTFLALAALFSVLPLQAQWSVSYLNDTRVIAATADAKAIEATGGSYALERNVSFFIPFIRLSARAALTNFSSKEDLTLQISPDPIGSVTTEIQEVNGTLFAGIPLGSWLRVYAGYGWVYETVNVKTQLLANSSVTKLDDTNFGFSTVYGARIFLGRYLSVNYEIREVEYEKKDLKTNASTRSAMGISLHF